VTVGLAIGFGSSDHLAAAYGIAVSLTMLLTTILLFVAMREIWQWSLWLALPLAGLFFCIDASFVAANSMKIAEGGWVPLAVALIVYGLLRIWHRGTMVVADVTQKEIEPIDQFLGRLSAEGVARVPGTAIFLTRTLAGTPPVLAWYVKHSRALRQHVLVLTLITESVPWFRSDDRLTIENAGPNFWRLTARYGFMERRNVPALLHDANALGCGVDLDDVTYYVGRETILPRRNGRLGWQGQIFALMQRNSPYIGQFLQLPREDVVEIGREVEL
jgi:KUP system potassium uptake protein